MDKPRVSSASRLQEPFSKLFEKATSLLRFTSNSKAPVLDGEIVYSKNNVCVHCSGRTEPVPGYLSLRCLLDEGKDSTLLLHWVPNTTIRSHPQSVDSPISGSPRNSSLVKISDLADTQASAAENDQSLLVDISESTESPSPPICDSSALDTSTSSAEVSFHLGDRHSISSTDTSDDETVLASKLVKQCSVNTTDSRITKRPLTLSVSRNIANNRSADAENDDTSSCSGSTSGPDSVHSSSPSSMSELSSMCDIISLTATAESIAQTKNLLFPNSSSPASSESTPTTPSVFSVNLGAMRSLRLFYSDSSTTCGQLVIASRESQYKIFHFYNGGLDKLAEILEEWNLFHSAKQKRWTKDSKSPFSQLFQIVKPKAGEEVTHPEESLYLQINPASWKLLINDRGQICDEISFKKTVFFGGIDSSLRRETWPFLLFYYPYDSTYEQREQIRNDRYLEYQRIRKKRSKLYRDEAWRARFWRSVENIVEKDVVRTDRAHAFYKGEGNSNVELLKEILLNYAVAHPHLGYTQGMSDLLSPVLALLTNESDAYWCFVGLMQRTIFNSQPKDYDMDRQLLYLKELLRIMHPKFYQHLKLVGEAEGLLFVHRWILLCFKREFCEQDSLSVWETCWANTHTDYFHLFIALAIIHMYADDVLNETLPADEMLLHFSSLAHHMSGSEVLVKARSLMHQFRLLETIPCTLQDLCSASTVGMWDSGHAPAVECVGHQDIAGCPYMGITPCKPSIGPPFIDQLIG